MNETILRHCMHQHCEGHTKDIQLCRLPGYDLCSRLTILQKQPLILSDRSFPFRRGRSSPVHPTTPHSHILLASFFYISCWAQQVAEIVDRPPSSPQPLPESDTEKNLTVFLLIDHQRAGMERKRRKPQLLLPWVLFRKGIQGLTMKTILLVYLNLEIFFEHKV